jgi:Pectinacetylesterase
MVLRGVAMAVATAAAMVGSGARAQGGINNTLFTPVFLTDAAAQNGAVCLDGTPGLIFIQKGVGNDALKFTIHQQGGAWCQSEGACAERAFATTCYLGSSNAVRKARRGVRRG